MRLSIWRRVDARSQTKQANHDRTWTQTSNLLAPLALPLRQKLESLNLSAIQRLQVGQPFLSVLLARLLASQTWSRSKLTSRRHNKINSPKQNPLAELGWRKCSTLPPSCVWPAEANQIRLSARPFVSRRQGAEFYFIVSGLPRMAGRLACLLACGAKLGGLTRPEPERGS